MKRLHRSHEDRKIAGVCAGLGEYFELDAVFLRPFFLFSILFGGLGAVAYVVLWLLIPGPAPAAGEPPSPKAARPGRSAHRARE